LVASRAVLEARKGLHTALVTDTGSHLLWTLLVQAITEGGRLWLIGAVFRTVVRVLAHVLLAEIITALSIRSRWGVIKAARFLAAQADVNGRHREAAELGAREEAVLVSRWALLDALKDLDTGRIF